MLWYSLFCLSCLYMSFSFFQKFAMDDCKVDYYWLLILIIQLILYQMLQFINVYLFYDGLSYVM